MATATIAVALFVLGGFLWIAAALDRLGAAWSQAAELSVYLDDRATAANRASVEQALAPGGLVASFEFVSKEEAAKRFKQTFAELAGTFDSLDANPLPSSYEVRLHATSAAHSGVEELVDRLRKLAGVTDVRYDRQWLDRLLAAVAVVRVVGLVLGTVLTVAAALTVANVVRLALHARRDELEIMQLVGAPLVYIRGPFVMEGVLQGGFGAAVALVALAVVFLVGRSRFLAPLAAALDLSSVPFLPFGACLLLLGGGMAVGCLGGLVAALGGEAKQAVTES
jgi:cell division transport system permease protein